MLSNTCRFRKGVMCIVKSIKYDFRWMVGDGNIRFWEDTWFGTYPLAMQFWPIYTIVMNLLKVFPEFGMATSSSLLLKETWWMNLELWFQILEMAMSINFTEETNFVIISAVWLMQKLENIYEVLFCKNRRGEEKVIQTVLNYFRWICP